MSVFQLNPNDSSNLIWFKMLGLIALVPLLAVAVVYGSGHAMTQWSSRDWPGTEMVITAVDQSSNRAISYTYEFEVDGVNYTAQGRTTETVVTPDQIKALRSKYAVGTQHNVFFNPRDPGAYSVLKPGGNFAMQAFLVVLALVALVRSCTAISKFWSFTSASVEKG